MPTLTYFKTCVISQPTFLPWLGWFDLADQADLMVLLDDVAFSKQSWQQRNRIRTRNGLEFLTVPVQSAGRLGQRMDQCHLSNMAFIRKMLNSLQANYAKAPFFSDSMSDLSVVFRQSTDAMRLVDLNCALIEFLARRLDVQTPMIRASQLNVGGIRGEHVAAICELVGASRYLSAAGAEEYLLEDRPAFKCRGISVELHVYEHPQYEQLFSPFIPYACALDAIFNLGPDAPAVMRSGRRPSRPLGVSE